MEVKLEQKRRRGVSFVNSAEEMAEHICGSSFMVAGVG